MTDDHEAAAAWLIEDAVRGIPADYAWPPTCVWTYDCGMHLTWGVDCMLYFLPYRPLAFPVAVRGG